MRFLIVIVALLLVTLAAPATASYRYDAPGYHERYDGRCFTVLDRRFPHPYRVRACAPRRHR
jgi:hypothetical protein